MSKEEYLKRIFDLYNKEKISGETYDHMVMSAEDYSSEEKE